MSITTFSSREFDLDADRAMKAAVAGPVFIMDQGRASHVLLSMAEYERISGRRRNLVEVLSMPGLAEIEFDPSLKRTQA